MSVTDLIADQLTVIRNAIMVGKKTVITRRSGTLEAIVEIMKKEGFTGELYFAIKYDDSYELVFQWQEKKPGGSWVDISSVYFLLPVTRRYFGLDCYPPKIPRKARSRIEAARP